MSKHRYNHREGRRGIYSEDMGFTPRDKIKRSTNTNIHHITNKCRAKDGYNVELLENKIRVNIDEHRDWHERFHNMTPKEVVIYIKKWIGSVLSDEANKKLDELTNMSEDLFYTRKLLK